MKQKEFNLSEKSSDKWRTPFWLMNVFSDWFDPCPSNPSIDGLSIEWKDKTFVNPPYSNIMPWVEKAIKENKKGKTIVMLLRSDTSTKWFAKLLSNGAQPFFHNGRLKFLTPQGIQKGTPFYGSILFVLGVNKLAGDKLI